MLAAAAPIKSPLLALTSTNLPAHPAAPHPTHLTHEQTHPFIHIILLYRLYTHWHWSSLCLLSFRESSQRAAAEPQPVLQCCSPLSASILFHLLLSLLPHSPPHSLDSPASDSRSYITHVPLFPISPVFVIVWGCFKTRRCVFSHTLTRRRLSLPRSVFPFISPKKLTYRQRNKSRHHSCVNVDTQTHSFSTI